MEITAKILIAKTDLELTAMIRELAIELDCIGEEQTRRMAAGFRQAREAKAAAGPGITELSRFVAVCHAPVVADALHVPLVANTVEQVTATIARPVSAAGC